MPEAPPVTRAVSPANSADCSVIHQMYISSGQPEPDLARHGIPRL
jgi:hypothetical protein